MSSPPDPQPSDEALPYSYEAVRAGMEALRGMPRGKPMRRERDAVAVIKAAYAIDMPRREAEVRAATIREVIAWLRQPQGMGGDSIRRMSDANAIARDFGIDGDVSL